MGRASKKTKKTTQTKEEKLMDLQTSSFDLNILKGAHLMNENGAEFRIVGFYFYACNPTDVRVSIKQIDENGNLEKGVTGLSWSSMNSWKIQLQAGEN